MRRTYGIKDMRFITWAQKNTCLLCDYPLALLKHFHHIIAREDHGPDHYLNIVALCPNHHWLVELLKRQVIPKQKIPSSKWQKSAEAVMQLYNSTFAVDIIS